MIDTKPLPKYTGWFVLLKKDSKTPSGYSFVGFFNPEKECDEECDEVIKWDFAIPICDEKTMPEFDGW